MSIEIAKMPALPKYTGTWQISYENGSERVHSAFELMERLAHLIPFVANITISRL